MFRRVYWVIERVMPDGSSSVLGVYTSIPNLVRQGLEHWDAEHAEGRRIRLTLTKLDSACPPFGSWMSPGFEGIESCLDKFVKTEEFSPDQCRTLTAKLRTHAKLI